MCRSRSDVLRSNELSRVCDVIKAASAISNCDGTGLDNPKPSEEESQGFARCTFIYIVKAERLHPF
jgi:hypothetical protein